MQRDPITNSGVILVDKPSGISSAKAVAIAKRRLGLERVGHAGTLDPAASGLLVLLCGSATRLASFAESGRKVYEAEVLLGTVTDTDDLQGRVVSRAEVVATELQISDALSRFVGPLQQVPPQVSALKIDGERAYKRVRAGETVSVAARSVHVYSIEIIDMRVPSVALRVTCSKGTYIRSIARDLGAVLGCGGCLCALRRTESFPYSVSAARLPDELTNEAITPWQTLFPETPEVILSAQEASALLAGNQAALRKAQTAHNFSEVARKHQTNGDPSGPSMLLYRGAEATSPNGLLVRCGDDWGFGVNISH